MSSTISHGVYFLANDKVYSWAVAFLESYRAHNPTLPLYLIPFDQATAKLTALAQVYKFEVFEHSSFPRLEAIGRKLAINITPTGPYWFRRFASFFGPFDQFVYLDVRMLVLSDLSPFIQLLDSTHCNFLHFEGGLAQVYNPGPLRQTLVTEKRVQGFNSGRWISRRHLFEIETMESVGDFLCQNRTQMNARNTDQFFLNYLVHTQDNVIYASVHDLAPSSSRLTWPRLPGQIYQKAGLYRVWAYGLDDHNKQVVLIHWAGIPESPIMERRRLFLKYRLRPESLFTKLKVYLCDLLLLPFLWLMRWLRTRRVTNQTYHLLRHLVARRNNSHRQGDLPTNTDKKP